MTIQAEYPDENAPSEDGWAEGAKQRIKAILQSASACGRTDLARHLAFDTDLSVEEASKILDLAPTEPGAEPVQSMAAAYLAKKVAAGTIGLVTSPHGARSATREGWRLAVDAVNKEGGD